jgi:hypothetical protein
MAISTMRAATRNDEADRGDHAEGRAIAEFSAKP